VVRVRDISINKDRIQYFAELLQNKNYLIEMATEIRERRYGKNITYSKNVFLPIIKRCRNSCAYCGFSRDNDFYWLPLEQAKKTLQTSKKFGCKEALIVSGDKPEKKYSDVREYYEKQGVSSTVEYAIFHIRQAIKFGLLPHANLGVLSQEDWSLLKPFVASAGLMLETTSKELLKKGKPHYASPDKVPDKRIESIIWALKNKIPFTTGILVGIGETVTERIKALLIIEELFRKYGFIQEIIIQPFRPLKNTPMKNSAPPNNEEIFTITALARIILPSKISIQVPPNLLEPSQILEVIEWGANDLGGISPVTKDYVNFEYPWPKIDKIHKILEKKGLEFNERLAVYHDYYDFVGENVKPLLQEINF